MVFLALAGLSCSGPAKREEAELVVFAAASLRDVVGDLNTAFGQTQPVDAVSNFAGSNVLAQQIDAAPVADVFLSANEAWIDFLDENERTVAGTRRCPFSNRLVLIARKDSAIAIGSSQELPGASFRHLAVAEPEAVPAGRYARAALQQETWQGTDVWSALSGRIAPTLDVRAALALVESDPEILGIVYRTDAATSDKVRVLAELAALEDQPITYCATLVAGGRNLELGQQYLDFLSTQTAREIAERHGFLVLDR